MYSGKIVWTAALRIKGSFDIGQMVLPKLMQVNALIS
jgi:hypothetical protein